MPVSPEAAFFGNAPQQFIGGAHVDDQRFIARMGVNHHVNFGGSAPIVAKH